MTAPLTVTKGHGTQNDFVLLDDRTGDLELGPALVRALADRRAGIGGDGVIRLVASEHLPEGAAALAEDPDATWFMDYRNADGSVAEMCGNGVRVLAAFAERLGLWDGSGELVLGHQGGGPSGEPRRRPRGRVRCLVLRRDGGVVAPAGPAGHRGRGRRRGHRARPSRAARGAQRRRREPAHRHGPGGSGRARRRGPRCGAACRACARGRQQRRARRPAGRAARP